MQIFIEMATTSLGIGNYIFTHKFAIRIWNIYMMYLRIIFFIACARMYVCVRMCVYVSMFFSY